MASMYVYIYIYIYIWASTDGIGAPDPNPVDLLSWCLWLWFRQSCIFLHGLAAALVAVRGSDFIGQGGGDADGLRAIIIINTINILYIINIINSWLLLSIYYDHTDNDTNTKHTYYDITIIIIIIITIIIITIIITIIAIMISRRSGGDADGLGASAEFQLLVGAAFLAAGS